LVEVVQAEGIIDRVILLGGKTTLAKFRSKNKIGWRARAR
jgi:hypothetical protein